MLLFCREDDTPNNNCCSIRLHRGGKHNPSPTERLNTQQQQPPLKFSRQRLSLIVFFWIFSNPKAIFSRFFFQNFAPSKLVLLLSNYYAGVQGDQRTHSHVVALRAVTSSDGMTADWYPFKPDFLRYVSTKICNTVRNVNRVVYDVTSKPPGTIEWE